MALDPGLRRKAFHWMGGNHVQSLRNVVCRDDKNRKQEDHVKQEEARKVGWADQA